MSTGRPRASSQETLAEAACELFLEQGYEATSVAEIAARAGVGRSSFFNYFSSKGDVFWAAFDDRVDVADAALAEGAPLQRALLDLAEGFAPDSLALAVVNARQMGIEEELDRESSVRRSRIARAVGAALRAQGVDGLRADVVGSAYGGAVMAAIDEWARQGAGRTSLTDVLRQALAILDALAWTNRALPDR